MSESKGQSLFILKTESGRLDSVEQYLKNRGWLVTSHTQPRESIQFILKKVPEYILLCVDHPNAKVRSLPKMLSQAVPSIIIPFAEDSTGNSFEAIRKLESKYSVYPPVSGPSVERVLLRIQRDEENRLKKEALQKERALSGNFEGDDDDDTIRLKSSGSTEEVSYAADSNQKTGAELVGPSSSLEKDGPQIQKGAGMGKSHQSAQDEGAKRRGPLFPDQAPESQEPGPLLGKESKKPQRLVPENKKKKKKSQTKGTGQTAKNAAIDPPTGSSGTQQSSQSPSAQASTTTQQSPNKSAASDHGPAQPTGQAKSSTQKKSSSDSSSEQSPQDNNLPLSRRQKQVPIFEEEEAKEPLTRLIKETLISEGAEAVLIETSEAIDTEEFEEIKKVKNLVCITIDSSRFSGYLLAALGKDKKIDKEFIEIMRRRLFHFLRNRGEPIEDEASMDIKVKPVDFKDFALDEADFLKKSVHKGDELAVAFFPYQKAAEKPEESHIKDMVLIHLDEISEDAPLEFNAYIHLEKNNKMICYTGKGRFLLNHQKEKLKQRGYSSLHVKKDEVQDIKRFKAQNYFNEKISEHAEKKKKKKP